MSPGDADFRSTTAEDSWRDYECRAIPPDAIACADPIDLGSAYVYLLGIYLGDGSIARAPRGVWRLRVFQDEHYPRIIDEISASIEAVAGRIPGRIHKPGFYELYSNWKHWTCVLPQHGPGRKHRRRIALREWQDRLVAAHPGAFLRGLIHSDGCRVINRVRRPTANGTKHYEYVRYFFTNASHEIRDLFAAACRLAGVECRPNNERNLSVARRESVARLDALVGPKR